MKHIIGVVVAFSLMLLAGCAEEKDGPFGFYMGQKIGEIKSFAPDLEEVVKHNYKTTNAKNKNRQVGIYEFYATPKTGVCMVGGTINGLQSTKSQAGWLVDDLISVYGEPAVNEPLKKEWEGNFKNGVIKITVLIGKDEKSVTQESNSYVTYEFSNLSDCEKEESELDKLAL